MEMMSFPTNRPVKPPTIFTILKSEAVNTSKEKIKS
jgi:hypothetical protein